MLWYRHGLCFVCTPFPSINLLPGVLARVRREEVSLLLVASEFSPRRLSMGDSRQEGSPLTGRGLSPLPGVTEAVGVASEGAHPMASGLSTKVVETIFQSRAPSMRKRYALKWKLFTSWCRDHHLDPVNCPPGW